jgi:DNA-directed RNA polymerase specialized sigma24 family protein
MSEHSHDSHQEPALRLSGWEASLAVHESWLRKVIRARTGDAGAVDEVFQRVAMAVLEQGTPLDELANAAAWLHRVPSPPDKATRSVRTTCSRCSMAGG